MTSTFKHLAAGTALALALSGAGATAAVASPTHSPASQASDERHMSHDRHFAVMMIPHHQGAIDMAELALENSDRPELRDLAERIIEAQTEEIEQLQAAADRLAAGGDSDHRRHRHGHGHGRHDSGRHDSGRHDSGRHDSGRHDSGRHGHGGGMHGDMGGDMHGGMMGEMEATSLEELAELSGNEFAKAFLEEMISHHRMALEMAEMELQMGTDPELRAMAEKMIEDQQAEIELMQGWLEDWFPA